MNQQFYSYDQYQPTKEEMIFIKNNIIEHYTNWDDARESQRAQYEKVKEALYIDITHNERSNDETVLLPQIYEQYNTLKATIIKSNYQNEDMSFNVQGDDEESEMNASMQKANIINVMKKMKFTKMIDDALHHWLTKGEMISFTYWDTKVENVRRQVPVEVPLTNPLTGEQLGSQQIVQDQIVPKVIYDDVKTVAVDPLCFVFDKDKIQDFDACQKITYTLENPYNIVANQEYKYLTEEDKDFLIKISTDPEDIHDNKEKNEKDDNQGTQGNQVSVLECWGDILLPDGRVLKNYVATVVADKFLARLEPNPYLRNPFAMHRWMPDPDSKRGRSPLIVAVPINQVSSQILNGQIRGLKLSLNPMYLAPADYFTDDRITAYPGKIIEYNPIFNDGRSPQPVSFKDGLVGFDFLNLLETKIEASTGAFKYMVGAQDNKARTATETSATVTGQNTRISMTIGIINEEFTIPTIENIATLQANTDFSQKKINLGSAQFGMVTPQIRQGNYRYTYGDSQSVVEAQAKANQVLQLLAPFSGKVNINWETLLRTMFRKQNLMGENEILTPDPIDTAIQQIAQQTGAKTLPPQVIDQLKQEFVQSGMFSQMIQQIMMGGNNGDAQQPEVQAGGMSQPSPQQGLPGA